MAKLVSKTYGDALYAAAAEAGRLDEFYEEVTGLKRVFQENKDWDRLMNSPKIVKEEKEKVIEDTFEGIVSKEIIGLMRLLTAKGHYKEMFAVFDYFIGMVKEEKGIGIAYVETAEELTEEQKQRVEARLLETTRYHSFEMYYTCDESLIGGMVIRIGDRVVDSSIRTKLSDLSRNLKKHTVGTVKKEGGFAS